jgi:glycerol-3-phosphate dehydrogenase
VRAAFERWDRARERERLEERTWDLVVVGGGIVGAGVARDAALRGLAVACVEAGDWAGGTSSRTTKFAHGGLRYLELLDFRLVRTALAERAVLLGIAPHLLRTTPFLLPLTADGARPSWKLRVGLGLYDLLAGRTRLGRHHVLDPDEAVAREPLLAAEALVGAGVYWDARVRDARLVVETITDARRAGAVTASYCAVRAFERWSDGWAAEVEDRIAGDRLLVRGRMWVNATGPWGDRVRSLVAPHRPPLLEPTKGIHVVVCAPRLPLRNPTALFADDGRLVFAVPEGAWTYLGTTDTLDGGDVDDLSASSSDAAYLLDAAARSLGIDLGPADVTGVWAGWRPLIRGEEAPPSAVPRDEAIEATAPGFVTAAGGKLTTYRAMAEVTVDRVVRALGRRPLRCSTAHRPLVPAAPGGEGPPAGVAPVARARARELFGPAVTEIFAQWRRAPETAEPMGEWFPYSAAEVARAAGEMVETLDDLVDRRLSALPEGLPLDAPTLARVAEAAAPVLGWDSARQREEVAGFRAGAERWPTRMSSF